MRINRALIERHLRRMIQGRCDDIAEFAVESWEVSPAEIVPGRPALFPDGAIEKISGLSPWRTWDVERGLIDGAAAHHAATRAHVLANATLAGAFVYCGSAMLRIGHGAARLIEPGLPERQDIDAAHLATVWTGADFFGHLLSDSFTLEMIPPMDALRLGAPGRPYVHAAGYRTLLDLPEPAMPRHARVGRLTVYTDYGQNAFKERRYRTLRDRMRSALPEAPGRPGVFLCRGSDGELRQLANQTALAEMLAGMGFDIIDLATTDALTIARRSLGARIVVGVEGSHLSHALYSMADGGAFLVIQPPDRFALPYKEYADRLGLRFGFVVGSAAETGFTVDLDEMARMLDRLG